MTRKIFVLLAILMVIFTVSTTAFAGSTTNVKSYSYSGLTFNGTDNWYKVDTWVMKLYNHNHGINSVTAWDGSHTFLCGICIQPWTNVTSDCWMTTGRVNVNYTSTHKNEYHMLWFRLNSTETGSHSITGSWSPDDKNLDPS